MLIGVAISVFLLLLVWWYFRDDDPLDKLPGPPRLPIIGNMHQMFKINPNNLLDAFFVFTKAHGYRYLVKVLNIRVLHIVDPPDVEVILSHSRNITKSFVYVFLKGWLGDGLLLSTGAKWHKRRKVLTPTFHFNILKNFALIFEEKTKNLVQLLKKKNGADVDVLPVISDYTLFTICETAMGTKLDRNKSAATTEYKNSILHIGVLLVTRLVKSWMWYEPLYKMSSQGRQFYKALNTAQLFTDQVIKEKRDQYEVEDKKDDVTSEIETKKRLALLDLLLEAEAKGEIDLEGIREEVNTFMFEGHDTTAMAITFGLMLLANHMEIQERIFEEVKQVLGDQDRTANTSELAAMKYLEAVIKEILRLYPSVPFIEREIVEDFKLGDVLIKKGTTINIHIYEMQRREDLFPDAESFKPERFLGAENRHPYAYVPFSAGPRNCIGQRFAMQEMKCTFSEIIRNFKLVPKVKGTRPKITTAIVIRPTDPIYLKFIPR